MSITVSELWTYPIKSCAGTSLSTAAVTPTGLEFDRNWVVVDDYGRFVSQREFPQMALIKPSVEGGVLQVDGLAIESNADGPRVEIDVWDDLVVGVDEGRDAAELFSDLLGISARLVRALPEDPRQVSKHYRRPNTSPLVYFADSMSVLLTSLSSLRELNTQIDSPIRMDRFRPNIVVDGDIDPYEEDLWREMQIGSMSAHVVKPCARCPVPDTDQQTGVRGREVRKALGRTRTGINLAREEPKAGIFFGQFLVHDSSGLLSVGDDVNVLSRAKAPNVLLKQ